MGTPPHPHAYHLNSTLMQVDLRTFRTPISVRREICTPTLISLRQNAFHALGKVLIAFFGPMGLTLLVALSGRSMMDDLDTQCLSGLARGFVLCFLIALGLLINMHNCEE